MAVRTEKNVKRNIQQTLRKPDLAIPALLTPDILVLCQNMFHVCHSIEPGFLPFSIADGILNPRILPIFIDIVTMKKMNRYCLQFDQKIEMFKTATQCVCFPTNYHNECQ